MPKLPCSLLLTAALLAPGALPAAHAAPMPGSGRQAVENETDAHDLSPEREAEYTRSVRQWLDSLPAAQRKQARKILREAQPGVHALRVRIREKKAELEALRFDSATTPDTLPRIGLEIQMLRRQLRHRLLQISELLRTEVGVPMGPLGDDGFWLNPQTDDATDAPHKSSDLVTPVASQS